MLVCCETHGVPLLDGGPGGLFCPACEYEDAQAAEYVPSDFSTVHPITMETSFKYAIIVRG
jgi:uncharacterized Zn finger protein (UPF0148 family)